MRRTPLSTLPNPRPVRHVRPETQPLPQRARWWPAAFALALFVVLLIVATVLLVRYQDVQAALLQTEKQSAAQAIQLSDARRVLETLSAPNSDRVTLSTPTDRQPRAEVVYQRDRGRLALVASNLAPLTSGHIYQLWISTTNASKPLPAGTFSPDERGHASMFMAMPPSLNAARFDVTIEAAEGSPAPTTKPILSGTVR